MNIKKLVYAALFAALTAVASQIAVPIQPVPINLAVAAVILCGAILGKTYGTIGILVYILLGCFGVPVFSGFRGGLSVIAGYTGGYIVGYLFIAFIVGLVMEKSGKLRSFVLASVIGVALCYTFGTVWYCITAGKGFVAALAVCVLPFIPGDLIKIFLTALIVKKIKLY